MQRIRDCFRRVAARLRQGALLSLAVWMLTGCHDLRDQAAPMPAEGDELPILRQVHGTHCHETRAMQLVIRDPATLAQVPLTDVPVDFSQEMLLIVTLGRVPSDLYTVNIDRVWREGPHLRVSSTVTSPPPGAPLVMASPYCIAVVPRCDLNIHGFSPRPPARVRPWQQSAPPEKW
ncbi:MAG TPA: hypothetical protein VMV94_09875 [Phycisphaerae bacterium]|nr:hypothetical protein [Phycisphaerae bacterium]